MQCLTQQTDTIDLALASFPEKGAFSDPVEGFGVLGQVTEGSYALPKEVQERLREEVMQMANSEDFLDDADLDGPKNENKRKIFFDLIERAEIVGSSMGGAAGYLQLDGEQETKLRFALDPDGLLLGFMPRGIGIRHELFHFVREAQKLAAGKPSLFAQERDGNIFYNCLVLGPREEGIVWFRTFFDQV